MAHHSRRSSSRDSYSHNSYNYSEHYNHGEDQRYNKRHYQKEDMAPRSTSTRRSTSVSSRSVLRSGKYASNERAPSSSSRYLENAVVAFEEFGDAPGVFKLYEFKDKRRSSEKLKKNVVIKIEVSEDFPFK